MEIEAVVSGLAALAQVTRLEAIRLLVSHAPDGLAAGALAQALGVPPNTLSTHLSTLAQAGLVHSTRQGRSIIYRAEVEQLAALASFLFEDCCGGRPECCVPGLSSASRSAKEPTHE